jgi:hypothetical protein
VPEATVGKPFSKTSAEEVAVLIGTEDDDVIPADEDTLQLTEPWIDTPAGPITVT